MMNMPIGQWVITAILIISVIGILVVVARVNQVAIPDWVVKIFWILALAMVAIFAVKFLMGIS